nr:ABC transporter ATP-binding protein [Clostridia bacterium]
MIELRNVYKSYNQGADIVKGMDLTINDGELVVLIGESGCGKTTTLQMINRLIEPTRGSILINGKDINTIKKHDLRRSIGYVIQDIGLFPHKTVEENISVVPLLCKKEKEQVRKRAKELMDLVGLPYEQYASRYPSELSGGQQQRVGVARALANDPDIILMDEPFSALDPITREQLQDELLRLHDELKKTIVFVTHDIDESIKLGDRIAIMQNGEVVQFDTPEEILKNPANSFVMTFIGRSRLWKTPDLLKAVDVINNEANTIEPTRTVLQAKKIIKKHNVLALAVTEKEPSGKQKLVGIVGLNRLMRVKDDSIKVKDVMKQDITPIKADTPLPEVLSLREKNGILFSPVVSADGVYMGMITNTSIVNVLSVVIPGKEEY